MLRRVAHVKTDISEACRAFIINVTRIGGPRTTLPITRNRNTLQRNASSTATTTTTTITTTSISTTSTRCEVRRVPVTANVVPISENLVTIMMEALRSSETSFLTTDRRGNIPEDGILQVKLSYRTLGALFMVLPKFAQVSSRQQTASVVSWWVLGC
jgi:hypothetical protein